MKLKKIIFFILHFLFVSVVFGMDKQLAVKDWCPPKKDPAMFVREFPLMTPKLARYMYLVCTSEEQTKIKEMFKQASTNYCAYVDIIVSVPPELLQIIMQKNYFDGNAEAAKKFIQLPMQDAFKRYKKSEKILTAAKNIHTNADPYYWFYFHAALCNEHYSFDSYLSNVSIDQVFQCIDHIIAIDDVKKRYSSNSIAKVKQLKDVQKLDVYYRTNIVEFSKIFHQTPFAGLDLCQSVQYRYKLLHTRQNLRSMLRKRHSLTLYTSMVLCLLGDIVSRYIRSNFCSLSLNEKLVSDNQARRVANDVIRHYNKLLSEQSYIYTLNLKEITIKNDLYVEIVGGYKQEIPMVEEAQYLYWEALKWKFPAILQYVYHFWYFMLPIFNCTLQLDMALHAMLGLFSIVNVLPNRVTRIEPFIDYCGGSIKILIGITIAYTIYLYRSITKEFDTVLSGECKNKAKDIRALLARMERGEIIFVE